MDVDALLNEVALARKPGKVEGWLLGADKETRETFEAICKGVVARRKAGQQYPWAAMARAVVKGCGLKVAPDTLKVYMQDAYDHAG